MNRNASALARQSTTRVGFLLLLAILLVGSASAQVSMPRGLAVVLDAETLARTGTISPGETLQLDVVVTDLDPDFSDGWSGGQFKLVIDPRLNVLANVPADGSFFSQQVAPGEWVLSFTDCITRGDFPFALLHLYVQLPAGATDTDNLRVTLDDLVEYGEPMLLAHCVTRTIFALPADLGGVLLNPVGPQVVHLSASEKVVVEGRDVELGWTTTGATRVTLDGFDQALTGTIQQSPTQTTLHTLTASDGSSSASEELLVEVIRRPRVDSFTVELAEGSPGNVRLHWSVAGASQVQVLGHTYQPIAGTLIAETTGPTWVLTATNEWGTTTAYASLSTDVPPFIGAFRQSPIDYFPGEAVDLVYEVWNADTVRIDPDIGIVDPESGQIPVSPDGPTEYTLTASNGFGTVTKTLDVVPLAPQIPEFRADPAGGYTGQVSVLSWNVLGADSVRILPDIGYVDPHSGEHSVSILEDRTYTLTAVNAAGSTQHQVEVTHFGSPIQEFQAELTRIPAGSSVRLHWRTPLGFDLRIDPDVGPVEAGDGYVSATPTANNTVYTLYASTPETTITASTPPIEWTSPAILVLRASPEQPLTLAPFDLTVQILGAESATLEPGFGSIDPSGGVFHPSISEPTVFTVTAINEIGTRTRTLEVIPNTNPPTVSLGVNNPNPAVGESFILQVTATNALTLTLEPGFGAINPAGGSFSTSILYPTTFIATATNNMGGAVDSVRVVVPTPLPVVQLSASKPRVLPNEPFELTVVADQADSLVLEPGFGSIDPTGTTVTTSIQEPTTFVATGFNRYGSGSAQLTMDVDTSEPEVSLSVSSVSPFAGEEVQLTTSVAKADSAWIEPGILADVPNGSHEYTVSFDDTTHVILHARNFSGSVTAEQWVNPRLPVATLTGDSVVGSGEQAQLQVMVQGAQSVTLEPHFGEIVGSGSYSVAIDNSTDFVLTATNPLGAVTRTHHVEVGTAILSFTATPPVALWDDPVELAWSVTQADSIRIDDDGDFSFGSTSATGSVAVRDSVDRVYTLSAYDGVEIADQETVAVPRHPFRIEHFYVSPNSVAQGDPATLYWSVIGNAEVSISSIGPVAMSGSIEVVPEYSTDYVLTCIHGTSTATKTARLYVDGVAPRALELSWSPDSIIQEGVSVLQYVPWRVYVFATGMDVGMMAYEFHVDLPAVSVATEVGIPFDTALNVGSGANVIVGIGQCIEPSLMTRVLDLGVISLTYVSPGTAITISGADPSSFADGSPGFQTCTGELLPFAVGSTLFTDWGGGLPVLTVDATATSSPRGVRVDWSAPEGFEPARVQILRRSSNRDFVVAATLAGQRQGSWLDEDFLPGSSEGVIYRITMEEGERSAVSAEIAVQQGDTPGLVVSRDRLLPNVPNPFNPSTDLRFALAEHGRARLEIYDTAGRRVWTWSREGLSAGEHTTTWTGLDDHGRRVSSGVYIVRLRTAQAVDHQRIVMLK